jgi:GNAT superfamily N-acetyltransferase
MRLPKERAMADIFRPCDEADRAAMGAIVNRAAEAYRGAIPADCWHEPYMSAAELDAEIAAGVVFTGLEADGVLAGIMGVQPVRNVILVRHAYVLPEMQGRGIGGALLRHLCAGTDEPILIGTWAAAIWAIRFYERHGFQLVPGAAKDRLLDAYWTIPPRQRDVSVVLAHPVLDAAGAERLVRAAAKSPARNC